MVTITEIDDDQSFSIPRTQPAVVGVAGGRSARPPPAEPSAARRRAYPRHDRILELADGESDEDDAPLAPGGISEAEARRIAGKTGIMGRHKLTTDDEDDEGDPDGAPMFQGALLAIPMALCFAFLRYSVRNQFRVWEDYSFGGGVKEALAVYACSAVLVAVVAAYKDSPLMKALLGIAATACGCAMVKATEIDRTYGAAMTTPGLAVLWIYCIARGTLGADAVSLALTLLYYATNGVRKIPFT